MTQSPNKGDLARDELPETRSRMSFDQLDQLIIYTLRHPTLFLEALRELKPEHYGAGETHRRLIWAKAIQLYTKFGRQPDHSGLEGGVLAGFESEPDRYTFEMRDDAVLLLETAYAMEDEVLHANTQYGRDLIVQFLTERMVYEPLKNLVDKTRAAGVVLANPLDTLERLKSTYSRVASIGTSASSVLLPPGWKPQLASYVSTGITWLDPIMGGGTNSGKVYGIFGPFGSFKTGFGVQVGVSAAQIHVTIAKDKGGKPRLVVYVVYEGGEDEIRTRALACAAKMPKKHIVDHFLSGAPLSTFDRLHPYEEDRLRRMANREDFLPETQRLLDAVATTSNFQILDFSGSRKNPYAGQGYIPEIVAALDRLRRETGMEIGTVIIDYAKLMVRRYMRANGLKPEQTRFYMGDIPDTLRRDVAEKFDCAVWILQQLNTTANKKAAGTAQHHADSSEAGDFGENLWYCFTLSAVNKAQGHTIQFNATKTRDTEGLSEPIVLQIVGDENGVVDARARFTLRNGKIVSRAVAEAVRPAVGERNRDGGGSSDAPSQPPEEAADPAADTGIPAERQSRTRQPGRPRPGAVNFTPPAGGTP